MESGSDSEEVTLFIVTISRFVEGSLWLSLPTTDGLNKTNSNNYTHVV